MKRASLLQPLVIQILRVSRQKRGMYSEWSAIDSLKADDASTLKLFGVDDCLVAGCAITAITGRAIRLPMCSVVPGGDRC